MAHAIKVKKHSFDNKAYRIQWRKPYLCEGICAAPTHPFPRRHILINPHSDGKTLMGTLIHEAIHAEQWYLDESTVERIGEEVSDFLWKCGYRLTDGKENVISHLKPPRPTVLAKKRKKRRSPAPS